MGKCKDVVVVDVVIVLVLLIGATGATAAAAAYATLQGFRCMQWYTHHWVSISCCTTLVLVIVVGCRRNRIGCFLLLQRSTTNLAIRISKSSINRWSTWSSTSFRSQSSRAGEYHRSLFLRDDMTVFASRWIRTGGPLMTSSLLRLFFVQ